MHPWQLELLIARLLRVVVWPDAPGDVVLTGGVAVSPDGVGNYLPLGPNGSGLPFALVQFLEASADSEAPNLYTDARLLVRVYAGASANDAHGVASLAGGTRAATQGQGKSTGRGLDEVVEALVTSLGGGHLIDATHGCQGTIGLGDMHSVDGNEVVGRELEITIAHATAARFYHACYRPKATGGVGQVVLTWANPAVRHDTLGNVLRRSAAGGAVPSSPTDGTDVPVAVGDTTKTVTGLATGTYQFALWRSYDETASGSAERYSAAVTASATVT